MSIYFNASLPSYAPTPKNQAYNRHISPPRSDVFARSRELTGFRFAGKTPEVIPSEETNDRYSNDFLQEVEILTNAFSSYLIEEMERKGKLLPVLLGGDTREATRIGMPYVAEILAENGIDVYQSNSDLPTPVLAYASRNFHTIIPGETENLGAILLACTNNQWNYSGYSFLMPKGSIIPPKVNEQIQAQHTSPKKQKLSLEEREQLGGKKAGEPKFELFNAYYAYKKHLIEDLNIDFNAIRKSAVSIYYDPMYATGRLYLPRLLKEQGIPVHVIHGTDRRPRGYQGIAEPSENMLGELSLLVKTDPSGLNIGLANDSDADKFGVLDETGRYLPPNDVLLLILYHLIKNRHQYGIVVRNQGTSSMLDALARKHGLPVLETPIGQPYIPEEFEKHAKNPDGPQVLMGAESAGGLSLANHIPGRDGIVANLLIAELVAKEKRPLSDILQSVKSSLKQQYAFQEVIINTTRRMEIKHYFEQLQKQGGELGGLKVNTKESEMRAKRLDDRYGNDKAGIKIWLEDGSWVLLEPNRAFSLQLYIEAVGETEKEAQIKKQKIFKEIQNILMQDFHVPNDHILEGEYS